MEKALEKSKENQARKNLILSKTSGPIHPTRVTVPFETPSLAPVRHADTVQHLGVAGAFLIVITSLTSSRKTKMKNVSFVLCLIFKTFSETCRH